MINLLLSELRDRRGAMIGWSIGLGALALLVLLIFPSFSDAFAGLELPEFYQAFGDFSDFSSLEGFFSAEFSIWLPLIFGIYAISAGTGTLAGEEEDGTLEILLAQPMPRWQRPRPTS